MTAALAAVMTVACSVTTGRSHRSSAALRCGHDAM